MPVSNRGSKFLSYLYGVPSDFEMTLDKNFSKPNPNPKHGGRLNVTGVAGHTGAERHRCAGF